ncbi:glycosyltransferase family 25 protein [Pararhizobium sp. YC-54]|uniref:glycosyltransferase family 25 protein n=1 Tax=Pararhizobium sp. YC-54 TaxID=2986920 RepID=UPI0021F7A5EC|nr:glycosyltransferase family 25 protein [Pararhizobium sp. YC-54]MCV9999990.1 glycosyltransferase family 25 protein [Pararhizobium sp. YC-54]
MQSLDTYVINLDGSDDRLQAISQRLTAFGIDFERIAAVDGRRLDLATVPDYDAARTEHYMGRSLVGGEIGCYHSHLKVATRFLKSDARYALVLEDDALPLCNPVELLGKALADLDAIDPDWLLINIGNNRLKIATPLSHYDIGGYQCELVAAHYFPMTTSAIVWSREGARLFVEQHSKMFAPVDNYFRHWLTRTGHGYSFAPAPVTTTEAASQILAGSGGARKSNRRKWFYGLTKQRRLMEDKLIAFIHKKRFRPARIPTPPGA